MPYKKKQVIPGSIQFNKPIAELPEKERRFKHRFNLDMTLYNHKKGLIIKMNLIDYNALKNCQD